MDTFWNHIYPIPEGETYFWQIGPLQLWIKRLHGEWQIASIPGDDDTDESHWVMAARQDMPSNVPYRRFTFDSTGEDDCLILKPTMPDRSIVSRPEISLEVPRGRSADIICGVPLWIEIYGGHAQKPVKLTSIPVKELSKTWFGTAQEGEPCYAASTRAVRDFRLLPPRGFRVLCPVSVINETTETLPIERICIRVAHLGIYKGQNYLWSNRMKVTKSAVHATSRVTFGSRAPRLEPEAELVAAPRLKADQGGIIGQTFNHLKNFLGEQS